MKVMKLAVIALLATGSTVAIAEAASNDSTAQPSLIQRVTNDLQQSGLTNVKVEPGSFVVNATDRNGDPVSMYITPDSMTAISEVAFSDGGNNQGNGQARATNVVDVSQTAAAAQAFRTIPAGDRLGTQLIGLDVHNAANKSIGSIKDIAMDESGHVNGYILSVGGFLGIDEHDVAVRPSALNLTWNGHDKKWSAEMDTTAAQLKAAPQYKYAS
jgi:PRC-barrel domain